MSDQLTIKEVSVEVHKEIYEGWRVKLLIPSIGLYINGMRVYPPNDKHPDKWIVLTPTYPNGKGRIVEFNPNLELWKLVQERSIEAVKEHTVGDPVPPAYHRTTQDVVIDDIDDKPIDLSEIPF